MYNITETRAKPKTIQEWIVYQALENKRLLEQAKKDAVL